MEAQRDGPVRIRSRPTGVGVDRLELPTFALARLEQAAKVESYTAG
jgi:hypothetical protein